MIRGYKVEDKNIIVDILNKGLILDMSYINNDFSNKNNIISVYEDGKVKGYSMLTPLDKEKKSWLIDLYVNPEDRGQGIGSELYNKALSYLNEIKPENISARFVSENIQSENFLKKRGFKSWFGYYEMSYTGEECSSTDLNFVNYEKYTNLMIEGFYQLRKENDIKPFECSKISEEGRKNMNDSKENVYILIDDKEEIISTVVVENGIIDDLVVSKSYEGKGFGKKTTAFAINKALEKGVKKINLDVVMWNVRARHVYEKFGFKINQGVVSWRK